jgi:elongation factor P
MKKAKDIRSGNILKIKNDLFTVLKAEHFNPSEKACVMRMKMKNIKTNQVVNDTFLASDVYEDLRLDSKEMQYLYRSSDMLVFMDNETYDQLEVQESFIGDGMAFLEENMNIFMQFYDGKPIMVDLPPNVVSEIDYTEDVDGGNTSGNVMKDAKLTN